MAGALTQRIGLNPTGGSDPFWGSVVFLSGFNSANGSAVFVDESTAGRTVTTNGAVVATTTSPLVAPASASFPGATTDFLTLASDVALSLGGGDRTFEARINISSLATLNAIYGKRSVSPEWIWVVNTNGSLQIIGWNSSGVIAISLTSSAGLIVINTTYEIAASRSGSNYYLFINGVVVASGTQTSTVTTGSAPLRIGGDQSTAGRGFHGLMDEVRITDACRFTANYAPTVGPYPRS